MAYTINQLFHMTMFLTYAYTLYRGFTLNLPMITNLFKKFDPGQLKYLTIWNVHLLLTQDCWQIDDRNGADSTNMIGSVTDVDLLSDLLIQALFAKLQPNAETDGYIRISRDTCEMRDGLLIVFHVSTCVQFAFSVYYDYVHVILPPSLSKTNDFGGKFKFLTFWDAIIQAVFFLICTLNDMFGTNAVSPKKPPFIRKLKDYVHSVLSFPLAMFVGVTFWFLMSVDRELVFPKALDPYFPWWLNHLMHTLIMVSTFMETILVPRTYPKRSKGLIGHALFMFIYLVWIHVIYLKSGVWVYPVMDVLTWPLRILFFLTLLAFSFSLYYVGEMLDKLVWGNEHIKHQKSHVKSKSGD